MKHILIALALVATISLSLTGCTSMSERWRDWADRQDRAARKAVETDMDKSQFARPASPAAAITPVP